MQLAQINKIQKYAKALYSIDQKGITDDDTLRLMGLKLVDSLKQSLAQVKQIPYFYTKKKKEQVPSRLTGPSRTKRQKDKEKEKHEDDEEIVLKLEHIKNVNQLDEMKSLNDQLENYLMFKNKYDRFYRKYLTFA